MPKGKQTFPHKISRGVSWVGDVVRLTVNLAAAVCKETAVAVKKLEKGLQLCQSFIFTTFCLLS